MIDDNFLYVLVYCIINFDIAFCGVFMNHFVFLQIPIIINEIYLSDFS